MLRYAVQQSDKNIAEYVHTTLTKMAYGGIYDAIGGGFSRYSVDSKWHIPHFEKMLYDNGQLMSLYSIGYQISNKDLYKETVYKIHEYIFPYVSETPLYKNFTPLMKRIYKNTVIYLVFN